MDGSSLARRPAMRWAWLLLAIGACAEDIEDGNALRPAPGGSTPGSLSPPRSTSARWTGPTLAPPPTGTGGGGAGTGGAGGSTASDLSDAIVVDNPSNLASWPVTTMITSLELRPNGVHVEFSKRSGDQAWPGVQPPGWVNPDGSPGLVQYTL